MRTHRCRFETVRIKHKLPVSKLALMAQAPRMRDKIVSGETSLVGMFDKELTALAQFLFPDGWCSKFLKRNGIPNVSLHGEGGDVVII